MSMTTISPNTFNTLADRFFDRALSTGSLVHAYVLKGQDQNRMYQAVLDIAKTLNCREPISATQPCGVCPSCRWINQNAHPAVMTVSRLSYLVSDDGNDLTPEDLEKLAKKPPQTQIKTEQIGRLMSQLSLSSEYNRVVIFVDAEEGLLAQPSGMTAPYEWQCVPGNEKKSFHLRPLQRRLFNEASANRFLKTLEEPPPNTLFFFLTDSEENLLETIVSRCQVVPFGGQPGGSTGDMALTAGQEALYATMLQDLLAMPTGLVDIYAWVTQFEAVLSGGESENSGELTASQLLEGFQRFVRTRYRAGNSPLSFSRYNVIQKELEHTRRLLRSKVNETQTLNHLFWQLSQ